MNLGFIDKRAVKDFRFFYTDGCCIPNPGTGSWSFIEMLPEQDIILYEKTGIEESETTNNRMEYQAAIEAIKYCIQTNKSKSYVPLIHSDSELLVKTCNDWMHKWEKKNWLRKSKKKGDFKNLDLVKELFSLKLLTQFEMKWVKGHSGNYYNERCDFLAEKALWLYQKDLIKSNHVVLAQHSPSLR